VLRGFESELVPLPLPDFLIARLPLECGPQSIKETLPMEGSGEDWGRLVRRRWLVRVRPARKTQTSSSIFSDADDDDACLEMGRQ
jgi:hypothetical protein